jgi:hypothetical protein
MGNWEKPAAMEMELASHFKLDDRPSQQFMIVLCYPYINSITP